MKRIGVLLGLFVLVVAPLRGQVMMFSAGAELAAGFPMGDFGDDFAQTGLGFAISGQVHFNPMVAAYAEYTHFKFGLDTDDSNVDADMTDNGIAVGGELMIPTTGQMTPVVRLGVIYNQLDVSASNASASISLKSDRSLGFEAGAGLAFEMGRLLIIPMLRYRAYSTEFDGLGGEGDISYATAGVRLSYLFGG